MSMKKSSRWYSVVLNIVILAVVAVLLVFVILLVRVKLLQNAQNLGDALVQSYGAEEEMSLAALEREAELASEYVDEISRAGGDSQAIETWLRGHFTKLIRVMGEDAVDFYAVVDGQILAANPWEGDDEYPYGDTDWYRRAVEAGGEVVCGPAYTDAITGRKVVTLSKALNDRGDVFAMDVYIENESLHTMLHSLPADCSYYLSDANGTLLYSTTKWDAGPEQLQSYVDSMLAGIADGSLIRYDDSFRDPEGVERGLYYETMSNGWTVLITMPMNSILMGERNTVVYLIAGVALLTFCTLAFITVQDALRSRRMKKADDTAHMLGDSFYAIYRVNVADGTYESFKTYEDLRNDLPPSGPYGQLLGAIGSVVRPSTFQVLESSFSLESIRERVERNIPDYGGDYQRRFGEHYRWVNIRTLYDPALTPNEVILCFRDVDEEKRRELQHTIILQEALDAAQKGTAAKLEFFSRMSHDMRTPLNAILGYCDLAEKLRDGGQEGKLWEYVEKIRFAGGQLLSLINDILELSRMEAGKQRLERRELDLEKLLGDLAGLFRDRAQDEGKTMEVSVDFREPVVMGDEKQLSQIVNNLLSNAVKYSDPGDVIRLEARQFDFQEHSKYQIVVEDTGIGMSPQFLEHLFDPYARETAFSSRPSTGTGLGMAIVKSLVQQMSGEISVDSALGKGTRFTVTLPLEAVRREDRAQPRTAEAAQAPFDWQGRNILVAEDNELNREIITELLEQLGARVWPAEDGEQAVQVFQSAPLYAVDAVFMDMQMPKLDGCQAARAIRDLPRPDAGGVPIIAVTANAFAEDIDRTTQAGMNDHVSKPIDLAALSQVMGRQMAGWDACRRERNQRKGDQENGTGEAGPAGGGGH